MKAFVIFLLTLLIVAGLYLGISKYQSPNLSIQEAETLLNECKIYSVGESHVSISQNSFIIGIKQGNSIDSYKVDTQHKNTFYEKVIAANNSGKCPEISIWTE